MEVQCHACERRYLVAEKRIQGRRARFTCKCGATLKVDARGTGIPPSSSAPAIPLARIALKQISRSGSITLGPSSDAFEAPAAGEGSGADVEGPGPKIDMDEEDFEETTLNDWNQRRAREVSTRSRSEDVIETLAELEAKVEALEEETRAEANLFPVSEEVTRPEDDPRVVIHYPTYFRPYPASLRKSPLPPPRKSEFGSIQALGAPLYVPPAARVPRTGVPPVDAAPAPIASATETPLVSATPLRAKENSDLAGADTDAQALPVVLTPLLASAPKPGVKPVSEVVPVDSTPARSLEATPRTPTHLAAARRAPSFGPSHADSTAPTSFSDFPPLRRSGRQTALAWLGAAAVVVLLAFGTVKLFEQSDLGGAPMVSSAETSTSSRDVRPLPTGAREGHRPEGGKDIQTIEAEELQVEASPDAGVQPERKQTSRRKSAKRRAKKHKPAPATQEAPASKPWQTDPFATSPSAKHGAFQLSPDQVKNALAGGAARARRCASPEGPSGQGSVRVVFDPNGGVLRATVLDSRFSDTKVGRCVQRAFASAKTPPYQGSTVSTTYQFSVSKMTPGPGR